MRREREILGQSVKYLIWHTQQKQLEIYDPDDLIVFLWKVFFWWAALDKSKSAKMTANPDK